MEAVAVAFAGIGRSAPALDKSLPASIDIG
jgi:hypothetical protein